MLVPMFIVSTHQTINKSFQRERPSEEWGWSILLENKGRASKTASSPTSQKRRALSDGGFSWRRWTSFFVPFFFFSASLVPCAKLFPNDWSPGIVRALLRLTQTLVCTLLRGQEPQRYPRQGADSRRGCLIVLASRAERRRRGFSFFLFEGSFPLSCLPPQPLFILFWGNLLINSRKPLSQVGGKIIWFPLLTHGRTGYKGYLSVKKNTALFLRTGKLNGVRHMGITMIKNLKKWKEPRSTDLFLIGKEKDLMEWAHRQRGVGGAD